MFRVCCHHKRYVLLILIAIVVPVEILTHEIDGTFKEMFRRDYTRWKFVSIVAADVYSHHHVSGLEVREKGRVCLILYIIPELEGRQYLLLFLSLKKRNDYRYPVRMTSSVVPVPVVVSLFVAGEGG